METKYLKLGQVALALSASSMLTYANTTPSQDVHKKVSAAAPPQLIAKPKPVVPVTPARPLTQSGAGTTAPYTPPARQVTPIPTQVASLSSANSGTVVRPTATSSAATPVATAKAPEPIKPYVSGSTVINTTDANRDNCVYYVRSKRETPTGLGTMAGKRAIVTTQTPSTGAIAVVDVNGNSVGHVALVDGQNAGGNGKPAWIRLIEANWGAPRISTRIGYGNTLQEAAAALHIVGFRS